MLLTSQKNYAKDVATLKYNSVFKKFLQMLKNKTYSFL